MEQNGYTVNVKNVENMATVKTRFNVPSKLYSCHTVIVDGYILEGHVPAADVARLLTERPDDIIGLAVPGMPVGSPGMTVEGVEPQAYNVIAFDSSGKTEIFSSYP